MKTATANGIGMERGYVQKYNTGRVTTNKYVWLEE